MVCPDLYVLKALIVLGGNFSLEGGMIRDGGCSITGCFRECVDLRRWQ